MFLRTLQLIGWKHPVNLKHPFIRLNQLVTFMLWVFYPWRASNWMRGWVDLLARKKVPAGK
jgi:hypothetical protein